MIRLISHPFFLVGLVIRLALLVTVLPFAAEHWYLPFLAKSVESFSLDPWSAYLALDGDRLAFPYGYAMWLAFIPSFTLAWYLNLPTMVAYGMTLLVADMAVLYALSKLTSVGDKILLAIYWLSPIILFATYWLGLNDLIPVALLMRGRQNTAGDLLAIANYPFCYILAGAQRSDTRSFIDVRIDDAACWLATVGGNMCGIGSLSEAKHGPDSSLSSYLSIQQ